ncbi:UbiH/UbiF family hydroxylase [Mesorhizobium sp. VNQ89]|uniref:UbiH/UbiF family hydroxylase n=1 Tax=Mesorhizobium quangtriensis TaxID=3157709 RepID=UPI0032B7C0DB
MENESKSDRSVIVAGTGPAGLIAALALADIGVPVKLVGPPASSSDGRTTALMTPALALLDSLGVLSSLEPRAAPLKVMRIVDATRRLFRSPVVTFRAAEIGEERFGLNMPNRVLNAVLEAAVLARPTIHWRRALVEVWSIGDEQASAKLSDGSTVEALLAVAADGRLSPARDAASIKTSGRTYPQAALVLNFSHTRGHSFISTEFHTETGPFTQVPLPGDRSSLVWVLKPEQARELSEVSDDVLSALVEEKMQSLLGRVTVEPGRQVYPLGATLPARFARNRVALVGEAAHVFPPIGAQGLNLGVRDVRDLVDVIEKCGGDIGSKAVLDAYDRRRKPDVVARSAAVNLLNVSLLSSMLPAQLARSFTLGAVGGFAPLRALFMREGLQPGSGLARVFGDLREQVGR